jgi:hypothetical protein
MTDKIIFSTYEDGVALQGNGLDEHYEGDSAEFEVTLPMDGVTARGTRTVGYVIRARAYRENGTWHFALEAPAGICVRRLDE